METHEQPAPKVHLVIHIYLGNILQSLGYFNPLSVRINESRSRARVMFWFNGFVQVEQLFN